MCPTVDEIFQRLRTYALNYNPNFAINKGTDSYIRFSCIASIIWGAYKHLEWTLDQIFPPTMSQESLEKFAASRGYAADGLTSAEFLQFVLKMLRNPASGGKPSDYERWSLESSSTGKAISLVASMVSASSNIPELDEEQLVSPHNDSPETGVAFECGTSDVGKYVIMNLGEAKAVIGVGMGFMTQRPASFKVYSANEDAGPWTLRGHLAVDSWWNQLDFDAVTAPLWKFELESIESLESWQTASLNTAKCYGIEIYEATNETEHADSATCLKNHYGIGTVMMLVTPSTLSMRCCKAIREKCEEEGPVAPKEIYVNVPKETALVLKVTMVTMSGRSVNKDAFVLDVKRYFASLKAGGRFIAAQLVIYAISNGADDATVQKFDGDEWVDAGTIVPGTTERLTLGELTVV